MRGYLQNIPSIGVRPKFLILYGLRRSVACDLERVEHFAGLSARESAAHETGENHRQSLLNGPGVAQGIEQIFGETWAGVDIGYVGSAQLLVEVAEGTLAMARYPLTLEFAERSTAAGTAVSSSGSS